MYAYSYKERKEEKKHDHNINFGCDWGMIKMFNFFPSSQAFVNGLLHQKERLFSWRIKIIAKCKRWRDALKLDTKRAGLQRLKDMHRNRRNRRRPKTGEEKARTNELARLRVAKSR